MKLKLLAATTLLASPAVAQDELVCPPRLNPMMSVSLPDDTGKIITVSEVENDTRRIVADYETLDRGTIGAFPMDGSIDWTNNSAERRRLKYRQSILINEGIMPIIPPGFDEVCWEPSTRRLITVYEQVLEPGESLTTPIFWEITTRLESQIADVNGDGWVDAQDQGLVLGAFGTDNPLYDLNQDGIVDGADLAIVLSQWSESFDDIIEANAGGGGDPVDPPVEIVYNEDWDGANEIFAFTVNELPNDDAREGHFVLPKALWRLT